MTDNPQKVLLPQSDWDASYSASELWTAPPGDPIRIWIEKFIPKSQGTCLELGCFPGRFLAVFGELGYELHGIDLTPRVETDLKYWLKSKGYLIGEIVRDDVWTYPFARKFDVVCSFGLIEHFVEWEKLIALQSELVADGGWLVLSTPNFRGRVQNLFHRWFDKENLEKHNLDAMRPERWKQIVQPLGFEMVNAGYLGPFDMWCGPGKRNAFQKFVVKVVRRLIPFLQWVPCRSAALAPYCGLIARKVRRV